jgi:pimeloyl-ACP methyl ester carboxylesterase
VAAGCRVLLWDYRGHGRSQAPEDPAAYGMAQVVEDLGRVLDWGAPGRAAALGGHSFGGLASLHYGASHRERLRALLLFGSGPGFRSAAPQAVWAQQTERTAGFLERRGMRAFLASAAGATAVGLRPELPAARAAAEAIAAQDPRGLALFARHVAANAPPAIDALPGLDVPALVLVGERDEAYLRAAEVMAARLPRSHKVVLPRAGHVANLEEADAFNAVLLDFLAPLLSAGAAGP